MLLRCGSWLTNCCPALIIGHAWWFFDIPNLFVVSKKKLEFLAQNALDDEHSDVENGERVFKLIRCKEISHRGIVLYLQQNEFCLFLEWGYHLLFFFYWLNIQLTRSWKLLGNFSLHSERKRQKRLQNVWSNECGVCRHFPFFFFFINYVEYISFHALVKFQFRTLIFWSMLSQLFSY